MARIISSLFCHCLNHLIGVRLVANKSGNGFQFEDSVCVTGATSNAAYFHKQTKNCLRFSNKNTPRHRN